MNKKLFGVVAIVAAFMFAVSPVAAEMEMEVGAMGGVNIADITGDDAGDTSTRLGFLGGGFFGLMFNENFGARVEVLYAMKGAKSDVDTGSGIEEVTLKLDYVEIPVLAVAQFPVSESFDLSVFAGPVVAFNITAEVTNGETEDISDFTKSTDFGAAVGVGGQFPVGTVNIFVQGRATIGLTTIDDSEDDDDVKNIAYGGLVGVSVPLGNGAE